MKNIATLIALIATMFLVGCAENPIAPNVDQKIEMKNVNVQILYDGKPTQWQASFKIMDMSSQINDRKPKDDTNAYNLGKFTTGARIMIVNDTTLNVRHSDNFLSIRMIVGNDTTIAYGVEGLYTVFTVK